MPNQQITATTQRAASFMPSTLNEEARTVTLRWTTGAEVKRESWFDGPFVERLKTSPENVRLERLNNGANLLNSHNSYELSSVLGVVERAWIEGNDGYASVRFSSRDDVEPIFRDVKDGIIRSVSVGYVVHKSERDEGSNPPIVTMTDWEPYELSLVAIPADAGAQVRAESFTPTQRDMTLETPKAGEQPASTNEPIETRSAEPTPTATPEPAAAAEVERSAADLRRERDILRACVSAGIDSAKADELVRSGKSFQDATVEIFTWMRDNTLSNSPAGHPARGGVGLSVTRDEGDTIERGIKDALGFRLHTIKEPSDIGRRFMRKRSVDLLEAYLVSRGVNTDYLTAGQIVDRAFHSTSDFPNILADVANKRLLAGYEEEPQTWRAFCTQRNLSDFKPHNNVQLQGKLTLTRTLEGGEYTGMTLVEGKSTWQLATYTGKLLWTRQMIVNDDLGAFESVIMKAGRGARTTESDIVWALLTTGSVTGGQSYGGGATTGIDGAALFAQAHANTGTGVIATAGMNSARTAMGKQKDIAGNELNLFPSYVLVPTSKATVAEQFLLAPNYTPAANTGDAGPNVFSGRVQIIVENRLETRDSALWYAVADPRRVETIEYGYLAGEEGPQISVTDRRDPDGAEMLVRMDFGAAVQDFRGFYRSTGA